MDTIETEISTLPSVKTLKKMGVKDYKPSLNHLVQNSSKISNISRNPSLELIGPKVNSIRTTQDSFPIIEEKCIQQLPVINSRIP